MIAKPIQKLNRLAQIGILQALTSSPHALMAQLTNMARNRTVPQDLAAAVCSIVGRMKTSAKLKGLGVLVGQLTRKNPERWRMEMAAHAIGDIEALLEASGIDDEEGGERPAPKARHAAHPQERQHSAADGWTPGGPSAPGRSSPVRRPAAGSGIAIRTGGAASCV